MKQLWQTLTTCAALCVLGYCSACGLSDQGEDQNSKAKNKSPDPVRTVNAAAGNVDVPLNRLNPNEVRGKEAVMQRLKDLFAKTNSESFTSLKSSYQPPAPDYKIIKGSNGRSTLFYRFRFVPASTFSDSLEAIVSDYGVVELIEKIGEKYPYQNAVMINDVDEKMEELKNFLLAVDQPQPQILVESQIVEVYLEEGAQRDMSLNYSHTDSNGNVMTYGFTNDSPAQNRLAGQGGTVSGKFNTSGDDTLGIAARLLDTSTDAKILSAPNIIADQGVTAQIATGEELPIPSSQTTSSSTNLSFEYKRIGISLKITPIVINDKTVRLAISPEVTTAIRYQTFSLGVGQAESVIPVISVRNVTTSLTVSDGDVVSLGGLYSIETNERLRKVPYIGDIPILGDLVNGRDTQHLDKQLLFFMKVHIIPRPDAPAMINLENTATEINGISSAVYDSNSLLINKPANPRFDLENQLETFEKLSIDELRLQREEQAAKRLNRLPQVKDESVKGE